MSYQDNVCAVFEEVVTLLQETEETDQKEVLKEEVCLAMDKLNSTYRILLDGYYACEYCKEVYCNVRDYRDTAIAYLDYAKETLRDQCFDETSLEEIRNYICEALCWTEKAQTVLCVCDDIVSCDTSCSSSSSSCSKSCDSSESCESTSSCSKSCSFSYFKSCETSSSSSKICYSSSLCDSSSFSQC